MSSAPTGATTWRMLACAALLIGAACDQRDAAIAGATISPTGIKRYVTGDAATRLGTDGRFALAVPPDPNGRRMITAERAGELALASVRTWGASFARRWEAEWGAPVDRENLRVDPRILFANSPYGPFPEGHHPAYTKMYGPYYLVRLNSGAEPVLTVSVSAYATEVTVDSRGLVHRPVQRGAEFVFEAVPADRRGDRFVSPEEAVERVGRATGARVSRAPELVRLGRNYAPSSAVWRLSLDREVAVRAQSRDTRVQAHEIYVPTARGAHMLISAGDGTASSEAAYPVDASRNTRAERVEVPVRKGEFTVFDPVLTEGEGL